MRATLPPNEHPAATLHSLKRETVVLVERALTVFLEYDFLDYSIMHGTYTGGHVLTYLSREADRMADELLAASGQPVPAKDRDRRWEIDEGGYLRPGAVLIDDLQVSTDRLESAMNAVPDWMALPAATMMIPSHRLIQVAVHHADLGRPLADMPAEDAEAAVAALPYVWASELEGFVLRPRPDLHALRWSAQEDGTVHVEGCAHHLLAWTSGRTEGADAIPPHLSGPPPRHWI